MDVAEYVLCHKQVLVEPKANFVRHLLSDRHLVAYVTQRARCSESVPAQTILLVYILDEINSFAIAYYLRFKHCLYDQ